MLKILKQKFSPANDEGVEYIPEETAEHLHDPHGGEHRPRNLGVRESLFHLDADWGTSLAYILPLSLALTGHLAPIYMIIIALIMALVANCYKIVCRHNPDGGGVYSSLKKISQFLAVVGALLLITDYIVTVALSVSDSYHYLQIDHLFEGGVLSGLPELIKNNSAVIWTSLIIVVLGVINWRGPHFSAKFAGIASASTFVLAGLLALLALPYIPAGLANIGNFNQSILDVFRNTTGVLLALSGVEAISNMTGIMKNPERTAKRALNIELFKVLFTTVVLGIAMNGLPANITMHGEYNEQGTFVPETREEQVLDFDCVVHSIATTINGSAYTCSTRTIIETRDDMLVEMGQFLIPGQAGKVYGALIGLAYGMLLVFAGNTAMVGITNVTYALSLDNELPSIYKKLNKKYGVPIAGLASAVIAPLIVVLIVGSNVAALAALYAIGVVGAVTMNLAGTSIQMKGKEKLITGVGAIVMASLFITLVFNKMEATIFAGIVLIIGLAARAIQKKFLAAPQQAAA